MRSLPPAAVTLSGLALAVALGTFVSPAHAAGLPQLDVTKFPPQVVWLVLSFIVLYVVMAKKALPRVGQILEERQFRIDDNLKKAEQLKADADAAAEAYGISLAQSRSKAQDLLRNAREAAAAEAAKRGNELAERLGQEIANAEGRIGTAKTAALADIQTIAADVAAGIGAKLTGETVSADEAKAAVAAVHEESK